MNALKPRQAFGALIVSEESRIGHESIEVSFAVKQLITAGVHVFCYMGDTERTLNTPIEKAMLALQTMADEMEREKARMRVTDARTRKAKARTRHRRPVLWILQRRGVRKPAPTAARVGSLSAAKSYPTRPQWSGASSSCAPRGRA